MLDYIAASDRAVRHAIHTGEMPNMNLIHALQRHEGFEACFGRSTQACSQTHCRWHSSCMALFEFDPNGNARPIADESIVSSDSKTVSLTVLGLDTVKPAEGDKVVPIRTRQPTRSRPRRRPEEVTN